MIALLVAFLALNDVRVVELSRQPAVVRTVKTKPASLAVEITKAVVSLVASDEFVITGPPFARYQTRTAKLVVVEIGVPVRKTPAALGKGMRAIDLPAGPAAELVVTGRHEDLPKAHAELDAWLAAEMREPAGPRWEVYLTNPLTTPDPAAQQTKIVVPLADAK
jgi:effector-binding domain-containing protein